MDLHPDWKEFIACLNARDVEFVVVGAFAVAFHTTPRSTGDIDFVTNTTAENAARVRAALEDFGVRLPDEGAAQLVVPDQILQIGRAPYRIDILTSIDGIETADLYAHREPGTLGGLPVSYPRREDLIRAKRAAGRNKDLADLDRLEGRD